MAKVIVTKYLVEEIHKKFKGESIEVFELINTLRDNPKKGKPVGNVSGIVIKEIRYKSFRFYFITDGHKLKIMSESDLTDLLIRFVRMSDKKYQQETINEIKKILINFGSKGFDK